MLFLQYKLFYFDGKRYISYIMPIRLALVGDPLPHGKTLSSAIESRRGTFSNLISILIKENNLNQRYSYARVFLVRSYELKTLRLHYH